MKHLALIFFILNINFFEKNVSCEEIIQTIFNEDFFYTPKPGSLNITGIDTITILDKHGYLNALNCLSKGEFSIDSALLNKGSNFSHISPGLKGPKIDTKIYRIKDQDNIPNRILSFRASLFDQKDAKYKCYFVFKKLEIKNDFLYIYLDKLVSNDHIAITYKKEADKWILIDKQIGKY